MSPSNGTERTALFLVTFISTRIFQHTHVQFNTKKEAGGPDRPGLNVIITTKMIKKENLLVKNDNAEGPVIEWAIGTQDLE